MAMAPSTKNSQQQSAKPAIQTPSPGALTAANMQALKAQAEEIKMVADIFGIDGDQLKHLKRAFFYANIGSGLVPDVFQGDYRSLFILSQTAESMGIPLTEVLQGGYFVHGRWGWYAEFMIKRVLSLGTFTAIDYQGDGSIEDGTAWIRAVGTRPDGSKAVGTTVSIKMARAEGWFDKKGSKWVTMPALMLRKRAATFLIRETAPHIFGNGTFTTEEGEDIHQATADSPQLIDSKADPVETIAALVKADVERMEQDQRNELFDQVEAAVAARFSAGQERSDIEAMIGMKLEAIESLKPEQQMALIDLLALPKQETAE